ncbi:MAG TPA: hypothetical protein VFU22_18045 [Roseiflexaceae bacterium]|nr:hypothetical protein [Roseiflexaceae bacterium]
MWIDQLYDVLEACLSGSHAGLLSVPDIPGVAPLPVHYQSRQLAVTCLIPRWSDLAEALQHQSTALIIPASPDPQCWLQYQGQVRLVSAAAWGSVPGGLTAQQANERFLVVALIPQRLDLFDEQRGWGARETLDLART